MGMSYGAALQSGSNAILYRHQRSFTPTPPRAKLSREEPDAGNLHVRVCEGWGWQHPHLLGRIATEPATAPTLTQLHPEYRRPDIIPFPPSNPYTTAKAILGQALFF